jgi:four helix bundle protein
LKKEIRSFEDLDVHQKLLELHLDVNELTMSFPKHEMHELGSQLRRSSNSIGANLAEGWNNKHINMYLEGINRSLAEIGKRNITFLLLLRRVISRKRNTKP